MGRKVLMHCNMKQCPNSIGVLHYNNNCYSSTNSAGCCWFFAANGKCGICGPFRGLWQLLKRILALLPTFVIIPHRPIKNLSRDCRKPLKGLQNNLELSKAPSELRGGRQGAARER